MKRMKYPVRREPLKLAGDWKIYDGSYSEVAGEKRVTLLKDTDGKIVLTAVDPWGRPIPGGYFVSLTDKGIFRHPHVYPEFGFPLDENGEGRIKIDTGACGNVKESSSQVPAV